MRNIHSNSFSSWFHGDCGNVTLKDDIVVAVTVIAAAFAVFFAVAIVRGI